MTKKIINIILMVLFIFGISQFGKVGYLYAKAQLAQYLLEDAWQQTLVNQQKTKPWSWADTYPVARLQMNRLEVDLIVLAGASGRNLAFGPGHMLASARPGEIGTIAIGGHRDTHFLFLQHLQLNDEITLVNHKGNAINYRVAQLDIEDSSQQNLLLNPLTKELKLITCYPFNQITAGGALRYVVTAVEV